MMQTQSRPAMGHIAPMDQIREHSPKVQQAPASSSRILYDIPCKVCRDHSSGKHYGIFACDGCAGFFKRSIRRNRQYSCKAKAEGGCMVDKTHRNQCRACRLNKCIEAGMNKDAVQHERGPRNSTLRRQMAYLFREPEKISSLVTPNAALNLSISKHIEAAASTASAVQQQEINTTQVTIATPMPHRPSVPSVAAYHHSINLAKIAASMNSPTPPPTTQPTATRPIIFPSINDAEPICEMAARLLFLNVKWSREVVISTGLNLDDQLVLLESSWRELFLLSAAQFLPGLDPTPLIPQGPLSITLAMEVSRFRNTLMGFHSMSLDYHEFECMKSIVLFKAGLDAKIVPSSRSSNGSSSPMSSTRLQDPATVARLRDGAQLALSQRFTGTGYGALRFGKLLLLLPTLRSVEAQTIEELFFKRTIGNTAIETVIYNMYFKTL